MKSTIKTFLVTLHFLFVSVVSIIFAAPIHAEDNLSDFTQTGVTNATFDELNPLKTSGSEQAQQLSTPGGIISRVLEFAFPIAGLILFVMIVWGGFEILTGAADKKSLDAGKQRISAAIIGFVLLFVSYWIIRIIEEVLGIKVIF